MGKRTRMHTNVNSLAPSRTALLLIPLRICTPKPCRYPQGSFKTCKGREGSHHKEVRCQEAYLWKERLRYRRQRMNFWPKLKLRGINLKHAIVIFHPCESI